MGKFLMKVVKAFNLVIDAFVIYVMLFGHMSASMFGKTIEFTGIFA